MSLRSVCLIIIACSLSSSLKAQDSGFLLGFGNTGIGFGDVPAVNGFRFNWTEGYYEKVNGYNITFWKPEEGDWEGTVNGFSFGVVAPVGENLNGVSVGLLGVMASNSMNGINAGGLALFSKGDINGLNFGGLAVVAQKNISGITLALFGTVAQGSMTGISFAGLGTVAQGNMTGISVAGLGTVSQGNMTGINIAGLGTVAQGNMSGLNFSVLGTVAQGEMFGVNLAGLALVSQGGLRGLTLGGLAAVGQESVSGATVGGLAVVSEGNIKGLTFSLGKIMTEGGSVSGISFGGYKIEAANVGGLNGSVVWTETDRLTGFTVAGYNRTYTMQKGIVIGLLNHTADLAGVQLGILNIVESGPTWARYLPFINARF